MRHIELLTFEYRDPLRRGWIRARYKARIEDITERYTEFRLVGEPELREVGDPGALTAGHLARGLPSR